ncbi:hypothetical protein OUZ56_012074 [Daphnia magna]|uniref:Helitron helicase-like domain-containing protein n=1 Tax=Daphnia magna TaxID=35525 RepID=A0ABQ9Z1Y4_9CRUS|nr:hypothetical protein OUZ56_012074 [Daphnia magna]
MFHTSISYTQANNKGSFFLPVKMEVVPLDGVMALADEVGGCPSVSVDRCSKERITAFTGTMGPGGSSLKGHVYWTRLESAAVIKKIPILPSQTPVRVLVVSPLLRSVDEETDATMISSTITIGDNANTNSNANEHQQLIDLLPTVDDPCISDASSNMFVVRPGQKFVSDSMPKASSNMARIRAYLQSRIRNQDGSVIPRAEAYGRISNEDLKKATKYDIECVKSKLFGQMQPRPPESLNGLASTFFTDQKIANQEIQHSQAAAQKNRQNIYASHANNGKAYIWLTISPNDAKSWQVLWFTLGPAESRPHSDAIPLGSKRFTVLGNHPVAAALNFQRILDIVIKYVIGWCQSKNRPYKRGGLFGVPKASFRVVEDQSRLTLHTHMLIWLCGHGSIEKQFDDALKLDDGDLFGNFMPGGNPMTTTRHVSAVTKKLADNIGCFIEGELQLPEPQ